MYNFNNPKIGDIVYPTYTPSKAGKIIAVDNEQYYYPNGRKQEKYLNLVTIQPQNGKIYQSKAMLLKCYLQLIKDNKKFRDIYNIK